MEVSVEKQHDMVYEAMEKLFESGVVDETKRKQVKQHLFQANERQYQLLNKALCDYLKHQKHQQTLEWIEALLVATRSN